MSLSIMSGLRKARYFLYTCLLFTKSDIKTTLIPVSLLASASAPLRNVSRLPHVLFWVWLHLLQCDLSNQTMDPYEDEQNKNYRPLPAKRRSLQEALQFRWYIVPACLVLSAMYSAEAVYANIALAGLTVLYNEFHAHRGHWVLRNLVNTCGLAFFDLGATLIAGTDPVALSQFSRAT
ncbi:hypothetical protein DICSQDRAFT_73107 [Dichomitus squalens LYAD-421 SS1]|uniref:UbiA prenyltransferase family-domain-containing protein n=2 Tax=Dichomitus squalens TaxID=114155 RepID=A0A4Q9M5E5_9APHY|nr:uncharacterized protein DICSQDRAFT_73107 [Dichomitus squalens LYAD-421 SS1]EJF55707.1 hypothetical protein DICSQDRAFT_73107 [Dichomitus squalens LYAD-421 SS1]TBU21248.1 hypothetical protein BD311DRAFT_678888 [Dichomitus squalens]